MARLLEFFNKQSKVSLTVLGLVLVFLLGTLDYLTGPELSFSIFYLLPISMAAWFVGRRSGIGVSVVSATAWFTADLMAKHVYSHPATPYWNTIVRLGFFLTVSYVLSALKASIDRQEELAQFIVHDLRSPLGNVITGLQTLQEAADKTMDTAQRELVGICLTSSNYMLLLINSLLDLARLESGHMPLQPGETSTSELVESSFGQVAILAERKQVTLTLQSNTDVKQIYADPDVTTRVLVNLLSNAIKFSRSQSAVVIYIETSDANMLAFRITDQGPGIPDEWVDRVFDKFAQVDARKAGGAIGSGLGLTFCRLAVQAQGGQIWLESEVGKGTIVTFTLPISASRS